MDAAVSRWAAVSGADEGARYASRFEELAAGGTHVHGEADLCHRLLGEPGRVLDAGCGTGRVAIRLAELGHDCVGVDADPSMLAVARSSEPHLPWLLADLAELDLARPELAAGFDLVVAAGNVIPLLAPGSEPAVVARLAGCVRPAGLLVAGFGLDPAHLPLPEAPVDLRSYDRWCAAAGLELLERFATWSGDAYCGGGYAVSVHRPARGRPGTARSR